MLPPEVRCLIYHYVLENEYNTHPATTLTYQLPPDPTEIRLYNYLVPVGYKQPRHHCRKLRRLLPRIAYTNSIIRQECLFEFSRRYLLSFGTNDNLRRFVSKFGKSLTIFSIEVDIFRFVTDSKKGKWWYEVGGHCSGNWSQYGSVFSLLQSLPRDIKLYLVITAIWRDFKTLRSIAAESGLKDRVKGIRFELTTPPDKELGVWPLPGEAFLKAQTVAAIMGYEEYLRDNTQAVRLVMHGCTGFDWRAPTNTET